MKAARGLRAQGGRERKESSMRGLGAAVALAAVLTGGAALAARHYVEAEDCAGLQRYPYHNDTAPGWYAREANCRGYGAPGRAYCAAIHETAPAGGRAMTQKLGAPIPAGTYKLFLRTLGPRVADEDSAVRVELGATPVLIQWRIGPRGAAWQAGGEVTLPAAVETVTFTAVTFGGYGHGGLYESDRKSIWVDTLYLTSNLGEKSPPDAQSERLLRAGIDPEGWTPAEFDPEPNTPAPEVELDATPILLDAADGRRNLWPNASFELGMNDGWAGTQPYAFADKDLSTEQPFHGAHSLHVPARINPFTRAYFLAEGGAATLSLYLRGSAGAATVTLKQVSDEQDPNRKSRFFKVKTTHALTATVAVTPEWQRATVSGDLKPGWYFLSIVNAERLFVDAVQLERGGAATPFAPRAELEGALRTGCLANIVYEEQRTLDAWFHNSGAQEKRARLAYRILDVREHCVAEGVTPEVAVAPGGTVRQALPLLPELRGIFSVTYALDGRRMPEGETVYLRMPKPSDKPTRHELGGNLSFNEEEVAVNARLGLKWVLHCKTREVGSAKETVHPTPEAWNWRDDGPKRPLKYGMDTITCFWPQRLPAFMMTPADRVYRSVRGNLKREMPDLGQWRDYCGTVAAHYQPWIKRWLPDDEAECSWDPAMYGKIVNATIDGVRDKAPGVKVGLSAVPEFLEELLKHVDPARVDFFGGSLLDYQYWEARYVRRLGEQYNKPWFCYGVGSRPPAGTMFHTSFLYENERWRAAWMARQLVNLLIIADLREFGHYAAVLRNDGGHLGLNKPLCDYEATPLPWGAMFGCLGTALAEAVPAGECDLGVTGCKVFFFTLGGRLFGVTWATATPDYDYHWKPAKLSFTNVEIPLGREQVDVYDMFMNPLKGVRSRGDSIALDLDEEPVFFAAKGVGREEFEKALKWAETPADPVFAFMSLTPAQDGTLSIAVALRNNTKADLKNVVVDFRWPEKGRPLSTAAEWIFREYVKRAGDIPVGESKTVTLATLLDARKPFEDGYVRARITAQGVDVAVEDTLWFVPAARVASPDELAKSPAAWLAYDWAWAPLGRTKSQFQSNCENFGYPGYSLDGRLAIRVGHDAQNLYIRVSLQDDQYRGEADDVTVEITTRKHPSEGMVVSVPFRAPTGAGPDRELVSTVVVPLKDFRSPPAPGEMLTFDVRWTDTDTMNGMPVSGTMRWAGGSRAGGFLLLGK
jgi:hypothetical protein